MLKEIYRIQNGNSGYLRISFVVIITSLFSLFGIENSLFYKENVSFL